MYIFIIILTWFLTQPVMSDHLSWETSFAVQKGRSPKTGFTVYLLLQVNMVRNNVITWSQSIHFLVAIMTLFLTWLLSDVCTKYGFEFRCRNKLQCISNGLQCDGHNNCGDFSDEANCQSNVTVTIIILYDKN